MQILVVDDHAMFREALVPHLKGLEEQVSVIEASSEEEALAAVSYYRDLDLILLDLGLPGKGGLSLISSLQRDASMPPIVVVSGESDPDVIRKAMDSGTRGFIPKTIGIQGLKNALQLVLDGGTYFPLTLLSTEDDVGSVKGSQDESKCTGLTQRQLHVLELLAKGLPNKLIARKLDVSEGTVKLHVSAILRSFGTQNRTEAVHEANRRGLLNEQATTD